MILCHGENSYGFNTFIVKKSQVNDLKQYLSSLLPITYFIEFDSIGLKADNRRLFTLLQEQYKNKGLCVLCVIEDGMSIELDYNEIRKIIPQSILLYSSDSLFVISNNTPGEFSRVKPPFHETFNIYKINHTPRFTKYIPPDSVFLGISDDNVVDLYVWSYENEYYILAYFSDKPGEDVCYQAKQFPHGLDTWVSAKYAKEGVKLYNLKFNHCGGRL